MKKTRQYSIEYFTAEILAANVEHSKTGLQCGGKARSLQY